MFRYNNLIQLLKTTFYVIPVSRFFVTILLIVFSCLSAYSQHKLANEVQLPRFEHVALREVFEVLHQKHSILFSYNSNLLDSDKEITAEPYQGLLINYLEKLLGDKYSFKETISHVIITYAPQRMDVTTIDMDTIKNSRTRISGYVKDIRTNKPVDLATVYDNSGFQTSTLTGGDGYFELNVRNPNHSVSIALSKENYRDTMIILLLPVDISLSGSGRKTGYYQPSDSGKTISNSAIGRLLTSSRQRIQNLNLGGFFVYSPFQVSLTPGLGTHGFFNSQVVNKFSLNMIGGYTAGVDGTELAGAFNINQFDMSGFQAAGLFNTVGGNIHGFQGGGLGNVGLNKLSGLQIAGVWNQVDTVMSGIQIAGAVNIANDAAHGMQFSGVVNIAKGDVGSQVAGGVNIAKKVRGIQLAVVNIADSSDYPIGLFNWIKNGSIQLSLGIDESKFAGLHFRSGGRVLYGVLGIGTYIDNKDFQYGVEAGLGGYLMKSKRFSLAGELVQRTLFDSDWKYHDANRFSLRIIPSIHFGRHFQLYAAPSVSYTALRPKTGSRAVVWSFWGADPSRNTIHGGGTVGMTYVLFPASMRP